MVPQVTGTPSRVETPEKHDDEEAVSVKRFVIIIFATIGATALVIAIYGVKAPLPPMTVRIAGGVTLVSILFLSAFALHQSEDEELIDDAEEEWSEPVLASSTQKPSKLDLDETVAIEQPNVDDFREYGGGEGSFFAAVSGLSFYQDEIGDRADEEWKRKWLTCMTVATFCGYDRKAVKAAGVLTALLEYFKTTNQSNEAFVFLLIPHQIHQLGSGTPPKKNVFHATEVELIEAIKTHLSKTATPIVRDDGRLILGIKQVDTKIILWIGDPQRRKKGEDLYFVTLNGEGAVVATTATHGEEESVDRLLFPEKIKFV